MIIGAIAKQKCGRCIVCLFCILIVILNCIVRQYCLVVVTSRRGYGVVAKLRSSKTQSAGSIPVTTVRRLPSRFPRNGHEVTMTMLSRGCGITPDKVRVTLAISITIAKHTV